MPVPAVRFKRSFVVNLCRKSSRSAPFTLTTPHRMAVVHAADDNAALIAIVFSVLSGVVLTMNKDRSFYENPTRIAL